MTLLLVDTSAWHRSDHPMVAAEWEPALAADRVAVTGPVRLEVLYSARSADEYDAIADELDGLHQIPCGADALHRAESIQRELGRRGALHHRGVKLVDLPVAAAAQDAGATIWHYDEDYDRIAALTGQPTAWIAPRGSL